MKALILTTILLASSGAIASIDPFYKEVVQRGYTVDGDSCVFPDGSRCAIADFNDGKCGQDWMTDDYCVPEGGQVWDDDRCCEGLESYLPEGVTGQQTCQKIRKSSSNNLLPILGGVGGMIVLTLILIAVMSRKRKVR